MAADADGPWGRWTLLLGGTVVIVYTPTCTKRNLLGSDEVFEVRANVQGCEGPSFHGSGCGRAMR